MGIKKKKVGAMIGNHSTTSKKIKLIILHGWAYSTEKWAPFLELLKSSGIDYELLKIPGLTAPIQGVWNIDDYVDWLKKRIETERKKVILLGHSNGGRIAAAFAIKFPNKVEKLILVDSAGLPRNDVKYLLKKWSFSKVTAFGKRFTSSGLAKKILYKAAREQDYNRASPELKKTMINLMNANLTEDLKKIDKPTLIIWGKNDSTTPLYLGSQFHRLIKGSSLTIINDAKHSPQFTKPEEVCKLVNNFIS